MRALNLAVKAFNAAGRRLAHAVTVYVSGLHLAASATASLACTASCWFSAVAQLSRSRSHPHVLHGAGVGVHPMTVVLGRAIVLVVTTSVMHCCEPLVVHLVLPGRA
jgi:hypothetical protein